VDNDDTIACEEVFGPVVAVIEVSDFDDEGLNVANDVEYGLSASVVTDDHTEANRFIDEAEAGVVKVNEKTGLELHVPFGGFKRSSSETWREQGDAGMEFYTIEKTVYDNY